MNDKEIDQFRRRLLSLRSALQKMEEEYKQTGETVELDQTRVGRLSRMDAMQSQQMALESSRRRQHQLLKIEGALSRIKSGAYGYCFICGEAIVEQRLVADPTSTRCMACIA
ncbi:MAG: TraR/DksA family transcriptional regulator [Gammaproteobacteria bacterium]|nr:TraR/DksA family transcriptional regulator [Gammaproteobacteria bacterium]